MLLRFKAALVDDIVDEFQWAPTLGGECYKRTGRFICFKDARFQWAPTLGGECYSRWKAILEQLNLGVSMGTHPWG